MRPAHYPITSDIMAWKDLKPLTRAIVGVNCGYAIRPVSKSGGGTVEIVLSPDILRRCGWKDGSWLKLQSDGKNTVRLVIVAGQSKTSRKLHIASTGRGSWHIPATGDIADVFGSAKKEMTALTLIEATSEHVVLELPEEEK